MRKILVCLDGRIGMSGTFISFWNLYPYLVRNNQIDFVTFRGENYPNHEDIIEKIFANGGRVFEIIRNDSISMQYAEINEILFKEQYDIIHINSSSALYFVLPLKAALKNKVPIRIVHAHSNGSVRNKLKRFCVNFFFKPYIESHATDFLACSEQAGIVKFGKFFLKKGIVLNNAIDVDRFVGALKCREKAREEIGVLPAQILLGCVGRCEPEKKHLLLIDILFEMINSGRDAKLLLVGDGSQLTKCKKYAETIGLNDRFISVGNQPNVEYWLSAMDIFLFPSQYEGFGIAALEAQAANLPVICSHGVARKANVTGDVFFMRKEASTKEWAKQIEVSLKMDVQNGCEKIKKLGYDTISSANILMGIYNKDFKK